MKKRILGLVCTLLLAMGVFLMTDISAYADEVTDPTETTAATESVCPMCNAEVTEWEILTGDTTITAGGHYRLDGLVSKRVSFGVGGTVCLDLAGNTLDSTGRTLFVGNSEKPVVAIMNVMDSGENGTVKGLGGTSYSGGVVYVAKGAILNIYGGTFTSATENAIAYSGGILTTHGTVNMHGGKIIGGLLGGTKTPQRGGAVLVSATGVLYMDGGVIENGTAPTDADGHCVYINDGGKMTLSGNASADDIAMATLGADTLKISGAYTGTVTLRNSSIKDGSVLAGLINDADVSKATFNLSVTGLLVDTFGNNLVAGVGAWCEACQKEVVWRNQSTILSATATGHFRLTKNISGAQVSMKQQGEVCLDLAGYTYTGGTRAFMMGNSNGDYAVTLNIMDSSEGKTGILQANGSGTGGVFYMYKNTTLNLYSGTLRTTAGATSDNGGVIGTLGAAKVNVYGGTILGGKITEHGGAVYLRSSGTLSLYGGNIISGTSDYNTHCVYVVEGGNVKLYGNGCADQIYFSGSSADKLTVSGTYTGKVQLRFRDEPNAADIGNVSKAVIAKEAISIYGTRSYAAVVDDQLAIVQLQGASVTDSANQVVYYDTLAEALAAWSDGSKVVKLLADSAENVNVTANVLLNMNGWDLTGAVTVADTMYCYDSCTDDGTVNDLEGYGVISGAVTGKIRPAKGYMTLSEGGYSFHKYTLELTGVSLRPGVTGIYYNSQILVDEAVLEQIDRFGIAVSALRTAPRAEELDEASLYTSYPASAYGSDEATSVLIRNIMTGENDTEQVKANAATEIYGGPYILLKDGSYVYGATGHCNLQQLTEIVDDKYFAQMSLPQHRAFTGMHEKFATAMEAWNIPNVRAGKAQQTAAANDGVLKVMIIGNSHALDAVNLLYEVFEAEGLPEGYTGLTLGAMYYSGCPVSKHVSFLQNNSPEYVYYKNMGQTEDGTWTKYGSSTLYDGLSDENWDIVLLQEMNTASGKEATYQNKNIETVYTYVANVLGYEPQFMWHTTWTNPTFSQAYVDYAMGTDSGDGEFDGSENESWVDDGTDTPEKLTWNYDLASPSAVTTWATTYETLWNNNRQNMYDDIIANLQTYVMTNEVLGLDGMIPSATAVQYALEWLGMHEQDMYRDYTHMSELGRITVAYLWYAKLTGAESIGTPKFTVVPTAIQCKQNMGHAVDYTIHSEMIQKAVNFALAHPYGAIENKSYVDYMALTEEEKAAYQAQFATADVYNFEAWYQAAVAEVTYTEYVAMTAEVQAAYAAARADFDTWLADAVANLTYAEYFAMTAEQKTAYAAVQGENFETWHAAAYADYDYIAYTRTARDLQKVFKATFATAEDFNSWYAEQVAALTYADYLAMHIHERVMLKKELGTDNYLAWYDQAKAAYEAPQA